MTQPILLHDHVPALDPAKIGISYSGGGPLVAVELGIARAFVQKGIIPTAIAGTSAGALAGFAHALDVHRGTGIDLGADLLGRISNQFLGLDVGDILGRVISQRQHIASLGDNAPLGPLVRDGLQRTLNLQDITTRTFVPPVYPKLLIAATDIRDGTSVWFSDDTATVPIEDALIASSAIPGIFPWRTVRIDGADVPLVDGGVVDNQPLSKLVDQGCGTIYACAVGPTDPLPPPANALDNAFRSSDLMMRQCTKLEEAYVRCKMDGQGCVYHIHPIVNFPIRQFNFTPALVQRVMDDATAATLDWLGKIERGEVTD